MTNLIKKIAKDKETQSTGVRSLTLMIKMKMNLNTSVLIEISSNTVMERSHREVSGFETHGNRSSLHSLVLMVVVTPGNQTMIALFMITDAQVKTKMMTVLTIEHTSSR